MGTTNISEFDPFAGPEIEKVYPLIDAQKEIWISSKVDNVASLAYNESVSVRLCGKVNQDLLILSIKELTTRHESLRAIISPNGSTMQILKNPSIDIPVRKIAPFGSDEWNSALKKESTTPFDLTNGPLFRAIIYCHASEDYTLYISAHHIICDGWSLDVILEDLAKIYSSKINSTSLNLNKPHTYYDYILLEPKAQEIETAERYWRSLFSDNLPFLDLPNDFKRPALRTYDAQRTTKVLDPKISEQIVQFANTTKSSLFSVLMTAWAVLIYRTSGQKAFVIGVPMAGQPYNGLNSLVGHCVSMLPIRFDIEGTISFTEQIRKTRNAIVDAYEHRQLSFGTLLQKLPIPRDPSRIPLIPVCFTHTHKYTPDKLVFAGCKTDYYLNARSYETFEMHLNANQSNEGIELLCHFNSTLYKKETIDFHLANLETVLQNAVFHPEDTLDTIRIISPQEVALLEKWNSTANKCFEKTIGIHELIEKQATKTPHSIAVQYMDTKITYEELDAQSNQLASYLIQLGTQPGTLVGISLRRSEQMLVSILGILKTGAAYVPLDPDFPSERLKYMISDAKIRILVSEEIVFHKLPEINGKVVLVDKDKEYIQNCNKNKPVISNFTSENIAYVIYTSGSTGRPKGVQVPHRSVVNFLTSMKDTPGIVQEDTVLALTTLSFDIAVLELLLPISVGACSYIISRETALDGKLLSKVIEESNATIMQATPATWRLLLSAGWEGKKDLNILCGGEAFPKDVAAELLFRVSSVWNMYGPTETTVWSTCFHITDITKPLFIGRPIANTQAYILDEHLQPVPIGVTGDLWIGGEGVTKGYLNNQELTDKSFIQNPFLNNSIIYKTGDRARYHIDGNIECLGRADSQVKIRGYRIELEEIEFTIAQFDNIIQCAVVISEISSGDSRLVAFVVPKPSTTISAAELKEYLQTKLPGYMIPQHIVNIKDLPLTPNGKIDRKKLPSLFKYENDETTTKHYMPPQNDLQGKILKIWKDVLGTDKIGMTDNFFDLGGHSLLITEVQNMIKKTLNYDVSIVDLFQYTTIQTLSKHLNEENEDDNTLSRVQQRAQLQRRFTRRQI